MEYGRFFDFILKEKISKSKNLELLEFYYPYKMYLYGNQYKENRENPFCSFKTYIRDYIKEIYTIKQQLFNKKNRTEGANILSGAYFGVNNYLEELGYNTQYCPWYIRGSKNFIGGIKYIHNYFSFIRALRRMNFQESISESCDNYVGEFVAETRKVMRSNNIKAFIASSTHSLDNRIPLKAAKEEGITTIVFLHGLPFPFYYEEPERADYLIVWSEKIKENFVKLTNFPEDRIFVSGHPYYQKMNYDVLRNSLDDVLIICPSSESERNQDRGNMVYYLLSLEKVLRRFGVRKVRYRPHPHENASWYQNYVDNNFFKPDNSPLPYSLKKATLVIGTLSTIVVEAMYYGVSYILYDPLDENCKNVYGHTTVPPFDGSESMLPHANTMEELSTLIEEKRCADIQLFHEYIKTPFDITFIKDLIK